MNHVHPEQLRAKSTAVCAMLAPSSDGAQDCCAHSGNVKWRNMGSSVTSAVTCTSAAILDSYRSTMPPKGNKRKGVLFKMLTGLQSCVPASACAN